MGAKDKREKERLEGINKRKSEVVEAAKIIFAEKSIEKATMQDIANRAEVGVASLYRYYSTKLDLVMEVALDYWERDYSQVGTLLVGTGIEQTLQVMDYFSAKFKENPAMLVFMEQFDAFISNCDKEQLPLKAYEKIISSNNTLLTSIIEKGIQDGSIRVDVKAEEIGNTCVELLMTLAQKSLIREHVLAKGNLTSLSSLDIYKKMLIKYLETA